MICKGQLSRGAPVVREGIYRTDGAFCCGRLSNASVILLSALAKNPMYSRMTMDNMSLLSTLCKLECELHQPECRRNRERLAQLLAPDFREFGRSGATYTRDHTLMSLPTYPEPPQVHAQDFAVNKLSDSIALLTYRSAHVHSSGELFRHTNRSSIWRLDSSGSGWQMVFHQGTPTEPSDQSAF